MQVTVSHVEILATTTSRQAILRHDGSSKSQLKKSPLNVRVTILIIGFSGTEASGLHRNRFHFPQVVCISEMNLFFSNKLTRLLRPLI